MDAYKYDVVNLKLMSMISPIFLKKKIFLKKLLNFQ